MRPPHYYKNALLAQGAVPEVIAPRLGTILAENDAEIG